MDTKSRLFPVKDSTADLIGRWRKMAARVAKVHPDWTKVQVAKKIQGSLLGRKYGTAMTYSIDFIVKSIRPG
jgi:hypothetical protein